MSVGLVDNNRVSEYEELLPIVEAESVSEKSPPSSEGIRVETYEQLQERFIAKKEKEQEAPPVLLVPKPRRPGQRVSVRPGSAAPPPEENVIRVAEKVKEISPSVVMYSAIIQDLESLLREKPGMGLGYMNIFCGNLQKIADDVTEYVQGKLCVEFSPRHLDLTNTNLFCFAMQRSLENLDLPVNLKYSTQGFINYLDLLVTSLNRKNLEPFQVERVKGLEVAIEKAKEELSELYWLMDSSLDQIALLFEPKFTKFKDQITSFLYVPTSAYEREVVKEKLQEFIREIESIAEELFESVKENFPDISRLAQLWDQRSRDFAGQFSEIIKARVDLNNLSANGEVLFYDFITGQRLSISGSVEEITIVLDWFDKFYDVIADVQKLYLKISSRLLANPLRILEDQKTILQEMLGVLHGN